MSDYASAGKDPEGLQKAVTFADFLRMIEYGTFHQLCGEELRDLAAAMENHAAENSGVAKAKMVITIEFKKEKGMHYISPKLKVTLPEDKPGTTVMWLSPENYFTPQDPRQLVMFGKPREVSDPIFGTGAT